MYTEEKNWKDDNSLIHQFIRTEYQPFDQITELLGSFLRVAIKATNANKGLVFLTNQIAKGSRVIVKSFAPDLIVNGDNTTQFSTLSAASRKGLVSDESYFLKEIKNDLEYKRINFERSSTLTTRILYQGQWMGMIMVGSDKARVYSARDQKLLEQVASELSYYVKRYELRDYVGRKFQTEVDLLVGASDALRELEENVAKAAKTDFVILLTGETGTGKELLAQAIHFLSPRRDAAFVTVNCGSFSGDLARSELFGHVKGAYTGASYDHIGKFEQADEGTIFLDEIADLDQKVQPMVLRTLETGEIERLGGAGKER